MDSTLDDSTDRCEMEVKFEAQRRQLFKASAIIAVCTYACASKLDGLDPECVADALMVAHDLIDDVAGMLEGLAGKRGPSDLS